MGRGAARVKGVGKGETTLLYVLYHGNCYDGFGAAWAAHEKYGDAAIYLPVSYGHEPPEMPEAAEVLIVDFSYPREILLSLRERHGGRLRVLDHHKTAEADLRGLDFCVFDMERSGAGITWDELHRDALRPELIDYVEDRDLWRFSLEKSREVSAWLASYPFDFKVWDELVEYLGSYFGVAVSEGEACLRLKQQYVESMCHHPATVEIGGYSVPAVNATVCFSEAGERLCELFPDAPFAAYWMDRSDGKRQWGLRSRGGFDVSVVAKQYGGGGHAAAAGFVSDLVMVAP